MNDSANALHRDDLTVEEYRRLGETGALPPDARTELIEGRIRYMPPIGKPDASVASRLNQLLVLAARGRLIVSPQSPIELSGRSEPEPDLALLHPREDFYATRRPTPADVAPLIEVADSSLHHVRDVERPLYARCGIPEFWLIGITGRRLVVCRAPDGDDYAEERLHDIAEPIALPELGNVRVDLSALFYGHDDPS